jgi:YMGG-like Gly-zipper
MPPCLEPAVRWIGALTLTVVALLVGCATDAQRTRTEGAGAGAVGGAVLGKVVGGRDGAMVGAFLGGLIGYSVGDQVADKKAQYAQREDALRASADRALALAKASRDQNDKLSSDIAVLELSVQRLRTERMSAASRQAQTRSNQGRLIALLASVDQQLVQMRTAIAEQSEVLKAEEARTKPVPEAPPSEGLRRVSASVRDLQQQERSLELARLQLEQIDKRRAY